MIDGRPASRVAALGATALIVSACAFERTVTNEGMEHLDTSGIVAGQSDRIDVLKQLGAPTVDSIEAAGTRSVQKDYFSYNVFEERCFRIGFERFWLITPFRWCFADHPYRLAVEFDQAGIVSGVYATRQEMIWPPFQDEANRPAPTTVEFSGSLLK